MWLNNYSFKLFLPYRMYQQHWSPHIPLCQLILSHNKTLKWPYYSSTSSATQNQFFRLLKHVLTYLFFQIDQQNQVYIINPLLIQISHEFNIKIGSQPANIDTTTNSILLFLKLASSCLYDRATTPRSLDKGKRSTNLAWNKKNP